MGDEFTMFGVIRSTGLVLALLGAGIGPALAEASAEVPSDAPAAGSGLPPLESREIGTRPAPKTPQDMLLPGETLRRRWADPTHPDAPGRMAGVPSAPARPAAPARSGAALPPPVRINPIPAAPAPVIAPPAPARPAPAATPRRRAGQTPPIRIDLSPCDGEYHLDGIAVDSMGRPCGGGF